MDYKTQVSEEQFKKDLIEMWFEEKSLKFFDKVTEYVKSVEIEPEIDLMTKINEFKKKVENIEFLTLKVNYGEVKYKGSTEYPYYNSHTDAKVYRSDEVDEKIKGYNELVELYKELTEQVKKCFICDRRREVNCSHCELEPTKDWLSK